MMDFLEKGRAGEPALSASAGSPLLNQAACPKEWISNGLSLNLSLVIGHAQMTGDQGVHMMCGSVSGAM